MAPSINEFVIDGPVYKGPGQPRPDRFASLGGSFHPKGLAARVKMTLRARESRFATFCRFCEKWRHPRESAKKLFFAPILTLLHEARNPRTIFRHLAKIDKTSTSHKIEFTRFCRVVPRP